MMTTIRSALLMTLSLSACATTQPMSTTSAREAQSSGLELASARPTRAAAPAVAEAVSDAVAAEITAAAQRFLQAKAARDFGAMWDLCAGVYRAMILEVGRRPAEADAHVARAQGFGSPGAVQALSDRDYFVQSRQHLAEREQYVYADGVAVSDLAVGPVIHLPFPGQRIAAYPVTVTLSDGSSDKIAAIKEGDTWHFLEK